MKVVFKIHSTNKVYKDKNVENVKIIIEPKENRKHY